MDERWTIEYWDAQWYLANADYVHPIPFDDEREAKRALARLNARDKVE